MLRHPTCRAGVSSRRHPQCCARRALSRLAAAAREPTWAQLEPVALDVEYSLLQLADGSRITVPAWVCLVDRACARLLKSHVQPPGALAVRRSLGGVPLSLALAGPPLPVVRSQLQALAQGRLLVGHGLAKDLAALGWPRPPVARFDTMSFPAFCNAAGMACSLAVLAKRHLGCDIQAGLWPAQRAALLGSADDASSQQGAGAGACRSRGRAGASRSRSRNGRPGRAPHDPEEDAVAVMRLYTQVVLPSTYEGAVTAATQQLLADITKRQAALQRDSSDGEADG